MKGIQRSAGLKKFTAIAFCCAQEETFEKLTVKSLRGAKRRGNLMVLLILTFKISPFGRNDNKQDFRSATI